MTEKLDAAAVLAGLKDFQQRTVNYAFRRMFLDDKPARRFLVADEVGLGKTLIARGLIARFIEHLQDKVDRIDVIYVCSNADIAAQNVGRLKLPGLETFAKATRLTLLPLETQNLKRHKVNFISFSPGTTFDQGNRTGRKDERHLIYQMLREAPGVNSRGLRNALQGSAGDTWFTQAEGALTYDQELGRRFRADVESNGELKAELHRIAELFYDRRCRKDSNDQEACLALIGNLRRQLAKTCLAALEPDLVILDEFQRFRELLGDPDSSPSAELAHALFNYPNPDLRVLLLSATPYKMFSTAGDEEDHYRDFLNTLQFLYGGEDVSALETHLKAFRTGLLSLQRAEDIVTLETTRRAIETALLQVMCRTERVGTTLSRDSMVKERRLASLFTANDLSDLRLVETISQILGERDTIEYWKSSPYLLNFMRGYQLKKAMELDLKRASSSLPSVIEAHSARLLQAKLVDQYADIDPSNARLRSMQAEIEQSGLWKLLWMPPSLPYWQPAGAYEGIKSVSKQLVFSAWNVVPDSIAAMLSYGAERHAVRLAGYRGSYERMPERYGERLRFGHTRDGRVSGMSALMLMFPSPTLARLVDPLTLASGFGSTPSQHDMCKLAIERIRPIVEPLLDSLAPGSLPDRRWYWVALARLEAAQDNAAKSQNLRAWCQSRWAPARRPETIAETDSGTGFAAHVAHWLEGWDGKIEGLGRVPDDLYNVLASLALAGPAVCALRSLRRTTGAFRLDESALLDAAVHTAEGLRSQFNAPTTVALLQAGDEDEAYWQRVLQYGLDGNLQALLDEYAHTLAESLNTRGKEPGDAGAAIAAAMFEAMSIRTVQLRPDELRVEEGRVKMEVLPIRCHFALRFGQLDDETGAVARKETVRAAFNSPFRPFVLASTSVGQEGLDFHNWCHAIVHWNLPSNPVDMEQREGRVHRYKGYAVRKNIARRFGGYLGSSALLATEDPWYRLFAAARASRRDSDSDLVPYWIFETPGGDSIERRVFDMPFSRDEARYRRLRKSLSLYRLVFAQPRQEDLLSYLTEQLGQELGAAAAVRWKISLEPPKATQQKGMDETRSQAQQEVKLDDASDPLCAVERP
ncbi:conserved hypothetical protein [Cupriavidus taiwanensis]|uniref:helicase-related protein n=1 Tax=Cupriavidus taiwanensis TaxID=164546 RepID=UPI000E19D566|nr:helicase-related protein [Cupriavidus taiwanensis]SPA25388.1 conserved hypothetical protein [Cupriavidus taiwanensis]